MRKTHKTQCKLVNFWLKLRLENFGNITSLFLIDSTSVNWQLETNDFDKCVKFSVNPSDGEEEEFYDAVADSSDGHFTLNIRTGKGHRRNSSDSSSEPDETTETKQVC